MRLIRLETGGSRMLAGAVNREGFNQTLLDCIDDGVKAILGEDVLESLFVRLEIYQRLPRDEVPRNVDVFFAALEKAFGEPSGKTVGRFIIKLLYARLGMEFDGRSNRVLADYILNARKSLVREN